MAKMFGFQEADFPDVHAWLSSELPKVPGNQQVFNALMEHGQLTREEARQAVQVGTDPFLLIEDMPFDGHFSPAQPRTVSFAKRLALDLKAGSTDPVVLHRVEATVLHEIVHWAWGRAGKPEVDDATGRAIEKGEEFEQAAYSRKIVTEVPRVLALAGENLGELSRQYESKGKPGAIGRDSTGGWSYGLYQLASRLGRVSDFLDFLQRESARTAAYTGFLHQLQQAGGDIQARRGSLMFQAVWRQLAGDPQFAAAQHEFIKRTHYDPFATGLSKNGIHIDQRSRALRDVAWSVSVQHGSGATMIFTRPFEALPRETRNDDARFINAIYHERSRVDIYFKKSNEQVRKAVLARFQDERVRALQMLQQA